MRTRFALLLSLLATCLCLVFFCEPLAAQNRATLSCSLCRQPITGTYFKYGTNIIVCQACKARYPACVSCGLPTVSAAATYQGGPVCANCVAKYGRCASCNTVLLGRFFQSKDPAQPERYCETCVKTKPLCTFCGFPKRGMTQSNGVWICPQCKVSVKKCSACGEAIPPGTYYRIPYLEGNFCKKCFEERPHCSFCNRPVVSDGRKLADGRVSCISCSSTAVHEMKDALDALAETVRFMESSMGMTVKEAYDFALVDNAEMAHLLGRANDGQMKELGYFASALRPSSPRPIIVILTDLPRSAFYETVAHEYAHLWQYEQNPYCTELKINEGFAQWAAAQWLKKKELFATLARLEARADENYGTGYQYFKEIANAQGGLGVLGLARTHQFPPNGKTPPIPPVPENLIRLSYVLPPGEMKDQWAFVQRAMPIDPARLRARQ
ncbi:TPA: hypothetical protein DDW35_12620 [Candidatus Sumerlaeota bacterium]|jgi:hypothetical protein|nr:hypothetical protein [Candidatus Sumerlaeota bacterium]